MGVVYNSLIIWFQSETDMANDYLLALVATHCFVLGHSHPIITSSCQPKLNLDPSFQVTIVVSLVLTSYVKMYMVFRKPLHI